MNIGNSRDNYGQVPQGSTDLKTDACCTIEASAPEIREAIAHVHPDVKARHYGCGQIAPEAANGMRILDLDSGVGQDAYPLTQLAGAEGSVGVDTTPEQPAVAREHLDWHAEWFGYRNVEFVEGDAEQLDAPGLEPGSFELVVSNCVINLVVGNATMFRDAHALLKPGGKCDFSDVYADHFEFFGDFATHYGIFPGCGDPMPFHAIPAGDVVSGRC